MPGIHAENLTKRYPLHRGARALVGRGGILDWLRGRRRATFAALDGVSLTVGEGESIGVIGRNGSGKSTLLKLLAGVTLPTAGRVIVEGRVASLLELGAGFHPMLTGRENVYLNAGLLGMRHAQVDEVFDAIVEFSGIGDFIDQTVDTYSSGMYVRIAFSVAVHANPDIFLVDEVLAVGDEDFQRKCRLKIGELKEQGKTIVFVSHDLGIVNTLCDRIVLLDHGKMIVRETPQQTIDYYLRQIGREAGVHRLKAGANEAVFCEGRLALYRDGREFTAPSGLRVRVHSMGNWYESTAADWEVTERAPDRCVALGRMLRVPITLRWEVVLDEGSCRWRVAMAFPHDAPFDQAEALIVLPPEYNDWYYGGESGAFPKILPGDLAWSNVTPPRHGVCAAAAAAGEATGLPAVSVRCGAPSPALRLQWQNAEYITGTRILQTGVPMLSSDRREGTHEYEVMDFHIGLGASRETLEAAARALEEERTVVSGGLRAAFENGALELWYNGQPLSRDVHLHTEFLAGGLWNFSQALLWDAPRRDGGRVSVRGESRRFPLRQHWEFWPTPGGIGLRVTFVATEAFEMAEYNLALGLDAAYTAWETPLESGAFPHFPEDSEAWTHLNYDYAAAAEMRASGQGVPALVLRNTDESLPFRMSALNSGRTQGIRVLQAIRVPEDRAAFLMEPGSHPAFEGLLLLDG